MALLPTVVIGCLPTYSGWPVVTLALLVLRIWQGFCAGAIHGALTVMSTRERLFKCAGDGRYYSRLNGISTNELVWTVGIVGRMVAGGFWLSNIGCRILFFVRKHNSTPVVLLRLSR